MERLHDLNFMLPICVGLFWTIVMLQSGLDKIINYKGNVSWLKEHFSKTFLTGMVPLLVGVLALFEMVAGICSVIGVFQFGMNGNKHLLDQGVILSLISLLMLIFGQRVAQEYDGAKTIAIYFGVAILSALVLIN